MRTSTSDLFDQYVIPNYGRFAMAPVRAEGARVWDEDAKEYLDFGAGIAVDTLGHCHPAMVGAIREQTEHLIHCSNLYQIPAQADLARLLVEKVVGEAGKCFFCNSGAEANEALIKLARKYGEATGRGEVLTFTGCFHGRTLATLSATAQEKIHKGFEPLVEGFRYLPFNDVDALKKGIGEKTVAILFEPVQGESGINSATADFIQTAAELARENDLLLMFDEVQCGLGRCGNLCGWRTIEGAEDVIPDAVSWAKGIGGGFPLGAIWVRTREDGMSDLLGPSSHGTTYGGSPLASAVGRAILHELERADLCANSATLGKEIVEIVRGWNTPWITEVRGRGLMIGLQIDDERIEALPRYKESGCGTPAIWMVAQLMDAGLLTVPAGANVVRFLPPLIITRSDVAEALKILRTVLNGLDEA